MGKARTYEEMRKTDNGRAPQGLAKVTAENGIEVWLNCSEKKEKELGEAFHRTLDRQ